MDRIETQVLHGLRSIKPVQTKSALGVSSFGLVFHSLCSDGCLWIGQEMGGALKKIEDVMHCKERNSLGCPVVRNGSTMGWCDEAALLLAPQCEVRYFPIQACHEVLYFFFYLLSSDTLD